MVVRKSKATFLVLLALTLTSCSGESALIGATCDAPALVLDPPLTSLLVNHTVALSATTVPTSCTSLKVTWSSDNPASATVSPNGLVTGIAPADTVHITATAVDRGTVVGNAKIVVSTFRVASVKIVPDSTSVDIDESVLLIAELRDENGNLLVGRPVQWESSLPTIASVGATGRVKGVIAGGPVRITVTSEGISASAVVTVKVKDQAGIRTSVRATFPNH